jgi:hypothetical protein
MVNEIEIQINKEHLQTFSLKSSGLSHNKVRCVWTWECFDEFCKLTGKARAFCENTHTVIAQT